jgi:hypothetical protein
MFRRSFLAGLAGIVVAAAAAFPAQAATQWVMVGEQTVSTHSDRDVLVLGADEGRYEALKFQVFGNRVAFGEVKVVYGNGTSEVLDVQEHVHAGEVTPEYDLKGQHRIINRIEFLYRAEKPWKGDALIKVFAKKDTTCPNTGNVNIGNWSVLGKREVNLFTDHDSIDLGFDAGRFRSLRFHVTGRPIYLYNVKVTFGNNQVREFDFNHHVSAGAYSPVLDLPGDLRVIRRIDLVYQRETVSGHAYMTIYGQS